MLNSIYSQFLFTKLVTKPPNNYVVKKTITTLVFGLISCFYLQAHPSYGIVVDNYRNIYFADLSHNGDGTVWKLSKDGKLTALFKDFHCHYIMLDKDQNLLAEVVKQVGENDYKGYVIRYKQTGNIDTLKHIAGYVSPKGNTYRYEPDGYLYKIDAKGKRVKHSTRKLEWVQSIYVDDEDNVYLPDKGVDNGILLKIEEHGKTSVIATDLIARLNRPRDMHQDCVLGVTKGCDGEIYIAETAGQRILKVLDDQKTKTFYKSNGDWFPTGIDFFAGDAYILEYKTKGKNEGPRITKVDESGKITTLFNYDTYVEGRMFPTQIPSPHNTNGNWWIYLLSGIAGLGIIIGLRKRKTRHQLSRM